MAKQTSFDYELAFNSAQAITTTASTGSTNEIDLGATGVGEGKPVRLVMNFTEVGASNVVTIKVCHKTSASVAATDNPITLNTVSATGQYHFTLPQNVNRYVKLYTTESGGTAGYTYTAWLTSDTV